MNKKLLICFLTLTVILLVLIFFPMIVVFRKSTSYPNIFYDVSQITTPVLLIALLFIYAFSNYNLMKNENSTLKNLNLFFLPVVLVIIAIISLIISRVESSYPIKNDIETIVLILVNSGFLILSYLVLNKKIIFQKFNLILASGLLIILCSFILLFPFSLSFFEFIILLIICLIILSPFIFTGIIIIKNKDKVISSIYNQRIFLLFTSTIILIFFTALFYGFNHTINSFWWKQIRSF